MVRLGSGLFLSGLLVASQSGCAREPSPSPASRPHIVVILADDLGYGDPGFRGSGIRTPSLDRLKREGLLLDRFYVQPECTPSRAALLTGRHPVRHGLVYSVVRPWSTEGIPVGEKLIAESFREAGYRTALVGKWHGGHAHPDQLPRARGFDHFYGHLNGRIDYFTHRLTHAELGGQSNLGTDWQRNGRTVHEEGYSTELLAREAVSLIEATTSEHPLFLLLALNAPHPPLQAPPEIEKGYPDLSGRRRTYAAMVEALDTAVGRVLDALDRQGLTGDTIVLFLSDNGAAPDKGGSNAPLRGGKATTYEGGIRVPAILRWPGRVPAGQVLGEPLSILDLYPTLAAAAGAPCPDRENLDGKDVRAALQHGSPVPGRDLYFATQHRSSQRQAILSDGWKLVRESDVISGSVSVELFDLSRDPGEERDLAGAHPERVRDLSSRLEIWAALHPAGYTRPPYLPPRSWRPPPDWAAATNP